MSRYVEGENRNQLTMITVSLDEMIPEDAPVRVIDAFVDSLDIKTMEFKYAHPKEKGRKPYDPRPPCVRLVVV